MGYDFSFCSLGKNTRRRFPLEFKETPDTPSSIPWEAIRKRLIDSGATENLAGAQLELDLKHLGHIGIFGSEKTISLDVHAEWDAVLSLYLDLLSIDKSLVIFDDQTGHFHNAISFRKFLRESSKKRHAKTLGVDQLINALKSADATERTISYADNGAVKRVQCLVTPVLGCGEAMALGGFLSPSIEQHEIMLIEKETYRTPLEEMLSESSEVNTMRIESEFWFVPDNSLEFQIEFCRECPPYGSDYILAPETSREREELLRLIYTISPFRLKRVGPRTIYSFFPPIKPKKLALFFEDYFNFLEKIFPNGMAKNHLREMVLKSNEMLL